MKEIVKRLMENHEIEPEEDIVEESTEDTEELDESTEADVAKSAKLVLNKYETILVEIQTLKKGSGYLASSTLKELTPADYAKRDYANHRVLDELTDIQKCLKNIRNIVEQAKR